MTRGTRLLLAVILGGVVLLLATIGACGAVVYGAGTVAVEVEEDGSRFRVSLPAGLVRVAVALVPASALEEATRELQSLLPAPDAGWRELQEAPDFVLLEVVSDGETVIVEKTGSQLTIAVDGPDARVRIAVPLGTVGSVLRRLARA